MVEYKVIALAAQECVNELQIPIYKSIGIFRDNQSFIKLANNHVCHTRTEYIELEHYSILRKSSWWHHGLKFCTVPSKMVKIYHAGKTL